MRALNRILLTYWLKRNLVDLIEEKIFRGVWGHQQLLEPVSQRFEYSDQTLQTHSSVSGRMLVAIVLFC